MINTARSIAEIKQLLGNDFLADKSVLSTYAGFSPDSPHAGQNRRTFSLVLSELVIAKIREQIAGVYSLIIADCWPKSSVLPFDMIRFDAFLDEPTSDIKIIEINTRNVGLHEVVEWLDEAVADVLSEPVSGSLNRQFISNQKLLHASLFGPDTPLLYMSSPNIPRWIYFDLLHEVYSSVCDVSSEDAYQETDDGLVVGNQLYNAVTRKITWPASHKMSQLDKTGVIRILQPRWMQPFGMKSYLHELKSPTILASHVFDVNRLEYYRENRANLVLKITDGSGSKSVYLGSSCIETSWDEHLAMAAERPEIWIIQDYSLPSKHPVIMHAGDTKHVPIQLGIFVLPCQDDPTKFDMDIAVKCYEGPEQHFTFDPSGLNPDIWFGHVIKQQSQS